MSDNSYTDDDLVYVDPDTRSVVGKVEWGQNGLPKPKARPSTDTETGKRKKHRTYPWGTYRSMKRVFRIEGKVQETSDGNQTLDDALKMVHDELI